MDLSTVLTSSVLAGLIAALVALRTSERKIQIVNITQERAKWRKAMRKLADEIVHAVSINDQIALSRLCSKLPLNLNPFHEEDVQIVKGAKCLIESTDRPAATQEFIERMSLLLKHDWDRAKYEAKPWFFRGREPRRVPFCEFKCAGHKVHTLTSSRGTPIGLFMYFAMLGASAGVLFFLAVGLTKPFENLVVYFNDSKAEKPLSEWAQFLIMSTFVGSIWSAAYLWFKGCEKKFLELWFAK